MSFDQPITERTKPRLEYHFINNFTPGISNRVFWTGFAYENQPLPSQAGAAQADGTWGCYGMPEGGLGPGPRVIPLETTSGATTARDPLDNVLYGCGLFCTGPLYTSDGTQDLFTPNSFEALFIVHAILTVEPAPSHWAGFGGNTILRRFWTTDIENFISIDALHGDVGNEVFIPGANFNEIQSIRTADSDSTLAGYPMTLISINSLIRNELGPDTNYHTSTYSFPDINISSGATDAFGSISFVAGATLWTVHQGRIVAGSTPSRDWGVNIKDNSLTQLNYSDFNDIFSGTTHKLIIPDLGSDGIYSLFSVNASELFLLRGRGGAISIRGDLDNPQIVRFPGVQGTEGVRVIGCNTPIGFVYAARSGIYSWRGGDESIQLSAKMTGSFWMSQDLNDNMDRRYIQGSMAFSNPFLFCPNNYMYDTRTGAWWRYSPIGGFSNEVVGDPQLPSSAFGYHTTGPYSGDVYAQAWSVVDYVLTEDVRMCVRIVKDQQTSQWMYTSQPLQWSQRRLVGVREIVLLAQGQGEIRVTLRSAIQPQDEQSYLFTLNDTDIPIRLVTDSFYFQGSDLIFIIEADSKDLQVPGPVVWEIGFGEADEVSL